MRRKNLGFTLIELLVVMATISILAAMLLPALTKAREQARSVSCRSNLKQIGLSFGMYQADYDEFFPTSGNANTFPMYSMDDGGWQVYINAEGSTDAVYLAPFELLAHEGYLKIGWNDNRNRVKDSVVLCPADRVANHPIASSTSQSACQYAHVQFGMTQSYAYAHILCRNVYISFRDRVRNMARPGGTMLCMDWQWWNLGTSNLWGVRPYRTTNQSPWYPATLGGNLRCPLERHGGKGLNILWADLHVSFKDAFEWNSTLAYCRYVPGTTNVNQPKGHDSMWFYYPVGFPI
jgi:prepilin-type N-terminal cleavage/methylation domain-containing protein/prepilin-type processing-associated H-X9-DG protein